MAARDRSRFSEPQDEPLFVAIPHDDPEMHQAYEAAARSMGVFKEYVIRPGSHTCSAKLRFRDPDLSEELGEDQFLYMWLGEVHFHEEEELFSGVFLEVPAEFTKWHTVGERLGFHGEDVFDWMVDEGGRLHGGFTLRVVRKHLPEAERPSYDAYIGVASWEPLPE